MYTKAREEQLFCAPIDTRKEFKVLDVGTGTGIWAIDLGMYVDTDCAMTRSSI